MKTLFKQMFYKSNKPYPPYIYLWILLTLVIVSIILSFFSLTDSTLTLGLCGFVSVWYGLFNYGGNK